MANTRHTKKSPHATETITATSVNLTTQRQSFYTAFIICVIALVLGLSNAAASTNFPKQQTTFSPFAPNVTYRSKVEYHSGGMQPLYNITQKIIWYFIGDEAIPEGYVTMEDMQLRFGPKVENNEWGDLIKHYWPVLLLVILTWILFAVMPIIGFCVCCCRCAGYCGGRREHYDRKYDKLLRFFFGFLLIICTTGILFGVIIAFTTNSFMNSGIVHSVDTVQDGSHDIQTFLGSTSKEVDHVLVKNYQELSQSLKSTLDDTPRFLLNDLKWNSQYQAFEYLESFHTKLPEVQRKLERMQRITNDLRINATQLSDGLRGVKREILQTLNGCDACSGFVNKHHIAEMDLHEIQYDKLPNTKNIIESIDRLLDGKITPITRRGRENLNRMEARINESSHENVPKIKSAIDKIGESLQEVSRSINQELKKFADQLKRQTDKSLPVANDFLDEYNPYRFSFSLGVCIVLLLILLCLFGGLLWGICGRRPTEYNNDCCNKAAGARLLMLAVYLIFLTISVVALAALVHFLLGVVLYRGVCQPVRETHNDAVFNMIDKSMDLNQVLYPNRKDLPPFHFSDVLKSCANNHSIFNTLRVYNRIDLNELRQFPKKYDIHNTLNKLVLSIAYDDKNVVLLSDAEKKEVLDYANSALANFDSDRFMNILDNEQILNNIPIMVTDLRKNILPQLKSNAKVTMLNQALHLETYYKELVVPMQQQAKEMEALAKGVDDILRYKNMNFENGVRELVNDIERSATFLRNEGNPLIKTAVENVTKFMETEIENYINMVITAVEKKIGVCWPVQRVWESTTVATCNRIVDPLNGFWCGLFLCVIIFLPTVLFALKLASLYRKAESYPGPYSESDYLYDAYSERDHYPLANGPKHKRRKNKDHRRREYYEDVATAAPTHVAMPPATSSARDTRYSDMAPKHWDGGPPRYQNPPLAPPSSEYERPPPYYYPGAAEQD